jgi:hypothetical protein
VIFLDLLPHVRLQQLLHHLSPAVASALLKAVKALQHTSVVQPTLAEPQGSTVL